MGEIDDLTQQDREDQSIEDLTQHVQDAQPADQVELAVMLEEVRDLRNAVERLDGYREGTMSTLRWVALIVVLLGVTGIIQLVSSAIDTSVSSSVSAEVNAVISQLDSRVAAADQSASNSEVAASRAEDAASQSVSAVATSQALLEGVFVASTQAAVSEEAGVWIAAISANEGLDDALMEADRAIRAGYTPVIYFFDDHYLPAIGPFASQEEADLARLAIQATLRGSPALFDLKVACPFRAYNERGFFNCFLEPTAVPES